jgi:hypothetical protein
MRFCAADDSVTPVPQQQQQNTCVESEDFDPRIFRTSWNNLEKLVSRVLIISQKGNTV